MSDENIIIEAISFVYEGERHIVKATKSGKFSVPVTEVVEGRLRTVKRCITAKEMLEHEVIKNCDPILYLQNNKRHRVFVGGDPVYLPAVSQGLAEKHDKANQKRIIPKLKFKKTLDKPITEDYNKDVDWKQETLDIYGYWPYDDDPDDGLAD